MRTDLELRHLRALVAVVDLGSHTRAARSLGISQSTVSETLASLERAVGAALFRRGGKATSLTRSGEALLPYARKMLALSSAAISELTQVSADASATLVVAAVESVSAYVLPPRLAALRRQWPKTRLEVTTAVCLEIRERVATGKADLGLVLEEDDPKERDGAALTKARLVVFASRAHPLAGRRGSDDDVRRCDFYMSDAGGSYHHTLRRHFEVAGLPSPRTQALGSVEGVKRGVLASPAALGLLPEHAIARELREGTLAEVTVRPALPALVLRAVLPPEGSTSAPSDALLASLRDAPLTAG